MKEGAEPYSRCFRCAGQKKKCAWTKAKSLEVPTLQSPEVQKSIKVSKPAQRQSTSRITEVPIPVASTSKTPAPTLKHKKIDEPAESSQPTVAPRNFAEVVVYKSQKAPPPPVNHQPPSPTNSFDIIELSAAPTLFSPSLEPPPSLPGSSSSISSLASQSLSLEIAILRSQLDAANDNLRCEREKIRQEREHHTLELQELEDRFDRERKVYQNFIKNLEDKH